MATIHPIKRDAQIIRALEAATGKMAVRTTGGKVVMLKIPVFKRGKKPCATYKPA